MNEDHLGEKSDPGCLGHFLGVILAFVLRILITRDCSCQEVEIMTWWDKGFFVAHVVVAQPSLVRHKGFLEFAPRKTNNAIAGCRGEWKNNGRA